MEAICHARALRIAAVSAGRYSSRPSEPAKSHIIVACPGRLEDQPNAAHLTLKTCAPVLDGEARPHARHVGFSRRSTGSSTRSTTAARPSSSRPRSRCCRQAAAAYTIDPKTHVNRTPEKQGTVSTVSSTFRMKPKVETWWKLESPDRGRTPVFVRTKHGADRLVRRSSARSRAFAMQQVAEPAAARTYRLEDGRVDLPSPPTSPRGIDVADVTQCNQLRHPRGSGHLCPPGRPPYRPGPYRRGRDQLLHVRPK